MTAANALFCQELKELMVESGRVFKSPSRSPELFRPPIRIPGSLNHGR